MGENFKIFVGIPAYNAEKTIKNVINKAKKVGIAHKIIIVNDSSTDNTAEILKKEKGIVVIHHKQNKGYGGSQKTIFRKFISLSEDDNDIIIILHADGQTLPEEMPGFVAKFRDKRIDIVLGSRALGDRRKGNMPLIRMIGDDILTLVENYCYGMSISTFASGYRGFRCRLLKRMSFEGVKERHTFDTEILVRAKEYKAKMVEIPVTTVYGEENLSNYNLISTCATILFDALRYKLKRK